MTAQEEAERFVRQAPPLNQKELEDINSLFTTYIFRRSKSCEVWTTCCHRHEKLSTGPCKMDVAVAVMVEPHQKEPENRWQDAPKETVRCPFCGNLAVVKELRLTGQRKNLSRYRRAVVLRWYRGALWARAYDCGKHYSDGYQLTGKSDCNLVGVYRFKPGLAEASTRCYWRHSFHSIERQDGPLIGGRWEIHSPFNANAEYGVGYDILGMDEIQKSPFRYCCAADFSGKDSRLLEYLTACCFYPRQIEMLMKAEMDNVVRDLVERGVKHAAVINWNEAKPAKVFGLNRQDLKTFLSTSRDIRTLELHKRLKGRVPLTECAGWVTNGVNIKKTFRAAEKWNLAPEKLMRYLDSNVGCARYGGMHSLGSALQYWEDYITAAEALGYHLHRENVLLPKSLGAAHDSAMTKHRNQMERERKKEQDEKDHLAAMAYEERRVELEKKYSFSLDGYVIKVPANKGEILEEGRKLQHCVGGYANRHIDGKLTILFLRKEKRPDKPWLTIEMAGNRLMQIHGYRNEGMYTTQGRFAPDPQEVHKDFLDTWLDWLKKGSPRDKSGCPKLSKKKGAAA